MKCLPLIFLLAACETPPPDLDSLGLLNPACVLLCVSDYTAGNVEGNEGSLSSTRSKTTSASGAN